MDSSIVKFLCGLYLTRELLDVLHL